MKELEQARKRYDEIPVPGNCRTGSEGQRAMRGRIWKRGRIPGSLRKVSCGAFRTGESAKGFGPQPQRWPSS